MTNGVGVISAGLAVLSVHFAVRPYPDFPKAVRPCPECAEPIRLAATRCPFCTADIIEADEEDAALDGNEMPEPPYPLP
jgi:hypothetical protein